MSTLLLTRTDIGQHFEALTLLSELREALRVQSESRARGSPGTPLTPERLSPEGTPGTLPGIPAYTVRAYARLPGGSPAQQDVVKLHDLETGALLAVMEAEHLVGIRTGLLGALAVDVLARPDASRVALLGAGAYASLQLKSLRLVRSLSHLRIWDPDMLKAAQLATRTYQTLSLPAHPAFSVEEAVEDADIVLVSTASRPTGLSLGHLRPGTHVSLPGTEVPAELPAHATFFNALGEVLAGAESGRTRPEQLTLFGMGGVPFLDLVTAWHVYVGAREDDSLRRMDAPL
jgi:ornithine cyclodeaminase